MSLSALILLSSLFIGAILAGPNVVIDASDNINVGSNDVVLGNSNHIDTLFSVDMGPQLGPVARDPVARYFVPLPDNSMSVVPGDVYIFDSTDGLITDVIRFSLGFVPNNNQGCTSVTPPAVSPSRTSHPLQVTDTTTSQSQKGFTQLLQRIRDTPSSERATTHAQKYRQKYNITSASSRFRARACSLSAPAKNEVSGDARAHVRTQVDGTQVQGFFWYSFRHTGESADVYDSGVPGPIFGLSIAEITSDQRYSYVPQKDMPGFSQTAGYQFEYKFTDFTDIDASSLAHGTWDGSGQLTGRDDNDVCCASGLPDLIGSAALNYVSSPVTGSTITLTLTNYLIDCRTTPGLDNVINIYNVEPTEGGVCFTGTTEPEGGLSATIDIQPSGLITLDPEEWLLAFLQQRSPVCPEFTQPTCSTDDNNEFQIVVQAKSPECLRCGPAYDCIHNPAYDAAVLSGDDFNGPIFQCVPSAPTVVYVHRDVTDEQHEYHIRTQHLHKYYVKEGEGESRKDHHGSRQKTRGREHVQVYVELVWTPLATLRPLLQDHFYLKIMTAAGRELETQRLTNTSKGKATVYHLKPDTTYKFQLIAIDNDGEALPGTVLTYTT